MQRFTQSISKAARPFAARGYAEKKTVMEQAGDVLKKTAQAFSADGAIGKEFKSDGTIGSTADEVGGPLSKDGSVGKKFEKDGSVGGKVQEAADKTWDAGKTTKANS